MALLLACLCPRGVPFGGPVFLLVWRSPMSIPILVDGQIVRMRFRGIAADIGDVENDQFFGYVAGGNPTPGGLTLELAAQRAAAAWATIWKAFQHTSFSWVGADLDVANTITAIPPNRYRITPLWHWSASITPIAGVVTGDALPVYCALPIRKITALPGRGSQGSCRIGGVPEDSVTNNTISPTVRTNIASTWVTASNLLVIATTPYTDSLYWGNIRGKDVNAIPGHPPAFYFTPTQEVACDRFIGTQITRKVGRHRS